MKRLFMFFGLALLSITTFSQSQIYNSSHLLFDWNRPVRYFGTEPDLLAAANKFKHLTETMDADHYGTSIEFGSTFYIHPTGVFDGFKAGLIVDFIDLGVNYFRYKDNVTRINSGEEEFVKEEDAYDLLGRFSVNIGLVATVSPIKNLYFDVFAKTRPTFGVHWQKVPLYRDANKIYQYFDGKPSGLVEKQMYDDTGLGFGLNTSFGLHVRYLKVMLGAEYVFGTLNFKYDDVRNDRKMYNQYMKIKFGFFFSEK